MFCKKGIEGQTFEVHNKTDGRACSLIILPEPDDVDAPFPTNHFFPTTDADAYSFSNLPENGDDGAPG